MKKIYGFKVLLNEELVCRAGFEEENAVVTCILATVRREWQDTEELTMSVGGMLSDTEQHATWYNNFDLKEGDKISFEVITSDFDTPAIMKERMSEEHALANKLKHYYILKEELKEHLKE